MVPSITDLKECFNIKYIIFQQTNLDVRVVETVCLWLLEALEELILSVFPFRIISIFPNLLKYLNGLASSISVHILFNIDLLGLSKF